jgi:hypothetical protein
LVLAGLAVMAALLVVSAAPATAAQVSQGNANKATSGDVSNSFSVTSTGNNSNQCVTPLQFGNTGSNQNAQGFLQFDSTAGDLEARGGNFTFAPVLSGGCTQQVQQSSAAFG